MNRNEKRIDLKYVKNVEFVDLYLHMMKFLKLDFDTHNFTDRNKKFDKKYFLEQMEDSLEWYKERFTFEVFFGHKKIIVVFEANKKLLQKFVDEVTSNAKWFEP